MREIKQRVKGSTLNTPETEEVLQALGFRGGEVHHKGRLPHMQDSTIPFRGVRVYEVCGDEPTGICVCSPNSAQNLRMRMIWELGLITIVSLEHRSEDFNFRQIYQGHQKVVSP